MEITREGKTVVITITESEPLRNVYYKAMLRLVVGINEAELLEGFSLLGKKRITMNFFDEEKAKEVMEPFRMYL